MGFLIITGLQIPSVSTLMFIAILPLALINDLLGFPRLLLIEKITQQKYLFSLLALVLFASSYFFNLQAYQINNVENTSTVLVNIARLIVYYILGTCLNLSKLPYYPYNLTFIFISLLGSSTTFLFLCVTKVNFAALSYFTVNEVNIPNFWGGEDLHIRNVDMFNSLTIGLFPVLLYGKNRLNNFFNAYHFIFIPLSVFCLLSAYSILALRGRNPILVFITSLSIATIVTLASTGRYKLRNFFIFASVIFLIIILLSPDDLWSLFLNQGLLTRFQSEGLESTRYEIWMAVLKNIFEYPLGGKQYNLPTGQLWAHNLWLDTVYETGITPLILLLLFQALHIKPLYRVLSSNLPPMVYFTITGISIGFSLTFIIQPIMAASVSYFAIFCFFVGIIKRLADDLEKQEVQKKTFLLSSHHLK
jgi:hypothetical protein